MLSIDYEDCQQNIGIVHERPLDVRKPQLLELGAITSYLVGPMEDALMGLARYHIPNVDLFAFLPDDLERYYNAPKHASTLEIVSAHTDPNYIAECVKTVVAKVTKDTEHRFRVRGFATYFPEISSLNDSVRQKAVSAVQNIIRIAGILKYKYPEHGFDTRFVEIVAGTRFSNLREQEDPNNKDKLGKKKQIVKAEVAGDNHKLCQLFKSLNDVSKTAAENDIYVSIEIEPGLLPFLSEVTYVNYFLEGLSEQTRRASGALVKQSSQLPVIEKSERIGLNVDICHMWACKITPTDLSREARKRITHVHIGDIGPGHLCDLVTGTVHRFEDYCQWFELLTKVAIELPRADCYPDFSCCLSVELEACRNQVMVAAAYHRAKFLLSKFIEQRTQRLVE